MTNFFKPVRKMLLFSNKKHDQILWTAIEAELEKKHYKSFSELCKAALHQYVLGRNPNQSVLLFIELQKQISSLQNRVIQLEEAGNSSILERLQSLESKLKQLETNYHADQHNEDSDAQLPVKAPPFHDPLLARLGPLLEEF